MKTPKAKTFIWRGIEFKEGVGGCYHLAKAIPGVKEAQAWYEEGSGFDCWLASIIPNDSCIARCSAVGSSGQTATEALDKEVAFWVTAILVLPGAREAAANLAGDR